MSDAGKARIDGISQRSSWLRVPDEVPVRVPEVGRSGALAHARARVFFFGTTTEVEESAWGRQLIPIELLE